MQDFGSPLRLGLSPEPFQSWLATQPGDADLLAARREILNLHRCDVVCERPESAAAVAELGAVLVRLGRIASPPPATAAMAWIGARLAEDLCVLTAGDDGAYRLTAAVVCFPNRWRLAEKIGTTLLATHAPVPDYAATVGAAVDRFLARLKPLKSYRRSNWGVVATTDLFTPTPTPPIDPLGGGPAFIRREDQSFLKLPTSGAVVFSIRTSFARVAALSQIERAALAESVADLSPAWRRYKALATAPSTTAEGRDDY